LARYASPTPSEVIEALKLVHGHGEGMITTGPYARNLTPEPEPEEGAAEDGRRVRRGLAAGKK